MQRHRWTTRVHASLLMAALGLWVSSAHADFYVSSYPADPTGSTSLDQVLHYDNAGNFLGVFAAPGNGLNGLRGLAFGPDGNLYAVSRGTSSVLRYDGTTGAFIDAFVPSGGGGLDGPEAPVFYKDGFLYVSNLGNGNGGKVTRYDAATGAFDSVFVASSVLGGGICADMAFGPNGNLFVCVLNMSTVLQFDGKSGALIGEFTQGTTLHAARVLAFGPDGNLYVADINMSDPSGDTRVARFDGTTGQYIDDYIPFGSGLYSGVFYASFGIGFGPDGRLYVSSVNPNADYDQVFAYDGTVLSVFIDGNADGSMLSFPKYFVFQ